MKLKPMWKLLMIILVIAGSDTVRSQTFLYDLVTEYQDSPIGIDVEKPRFSWKMGTDDENLKGLKQTHYRIRVMDENEYVFWDSRKTRSGVSLNIEYAGKKLEPRTKYTWTVTVWDQDGKKLTSSSHFEMGLMDDDPSGKAWNGAQWIGGGDDDLNFYAHALSVFRFSYDLQLDEESKTTKAGFVFGANDERLMIPHLNILGVQNDYNESYFKYELDISPLAEHADSMAKFNIYRVGYTPEDSKTTPLYSIDISHDLIDQNNMYTSHSISAIVVFGQSVIYIDGEDDAHKLNDGWTPFYLNPHGTDRDKIIYPLLSDIGFSVETGSKSAFSNLQISNFRAPSNVLFGEELSEAKNYDGIFKKFVGSAKLRITDGAYKVGSNSAPVLITADPTKNSVPMLRSEFSVDKKIKKARLYATARGIYELYLNGERVGDDYFKPGLTQYEKTHFYQTFDVTDMIKEGDNAIGAWLSEGWWSGNITYAGDHWNFFGDRQSFMAQMILTYEDGTEKIITTNTRDWKFFNDGPVLMGSFFQGEIYDARKEALIDGWAEPGFDDKNWSTPVEVSLEGTTYSTYLAEPPEDALDFSDPVITADLGIGAKVVKELTPLSVDEVRPGVFVYDLGQNMVGFPRIEINGEAGTEVIMRYAEVLYPDLPEHEGLEETIMMENIRGALTTDRYILKGGKETIQPRFTFHGFRYLEISGIDKAIPLEDVTGLVVSSIDELSSYYETSNELVNKLWENITWSFRSNFLYIPTDTPARNERMGWNGDINVFSKTATYLGDVHQFLRMHSIANRDRQSPEGRFDDVAPIGKGFGGTLWGSAGVIIPWEVYEQYGDEKILEENYEAMENYLAFLRSKQDPVTGVIDEGPLGDWLSPEGYENDNSLLWTAYQVRGLEIMMGSAVVLKKLDDFEKYSREYDKRKAFFNEMYVDPETHKTISSGYPSVHFGPNPNGGPPPKGALVDNQASYAIPLAFNVFDEENKPYAVDYLVESIERENMDELGVMRPELSLMTGFIGTASLGDALSTNGESELMYEVLQQTSYPSWLYSVLNGATSIWERLNSYTVENGFSGNNTMNSFNHYSFGAVGSWMYNYSLGIQRDLGGYKYFILQPTPDPSGQMTYAKGYYDSMYGRIESSWEVKGDKLIYKATVPPNTTAYLKLPVCGEEQTLESGSYTFECDLEPNSSTRSK